MKKFALALVGVIFSLAFNAYADTAGSGIPLLMLDSYGARAVALADAFTGTADDVNALAVNPAGLNTLASFEVSSMYMKYLEDLSFGYLAFGMPLSPNAGSIGAGVYIFSMPDADHYDSAGNISSTPLSAGDFGVSLGYANNPMKLFGVDLDLNMGLGVKYVQSKLSDSTVSALAFDIGALYRMDAPCLGGRKAKGNLGIGVSVQNLGPSVKYAAEETLLPRNIRMGIGYRGLNAADHSLLLGFDVNMPNDSDGIISIGLEYTFMRLLSGRIGYKLSGADIEGFSAGLGAAYTLSGKRISVDYALVPVKDFDLVHAVSLGVRF